jgi:hypothetical protein
VPEAIVVPVILAVIALLGIGVGALGLRLNRRAIRRGTYPHRDLPWYLGGVPDVKLDAPVESTRRRRRRHQRR